MKKSHNYQGIRGAIRYWTKSRKTPATLTDSDLDAYCQELLDRGKQYGTVMAIRSHLRRFLFDHSDKFPGINFVPRPPNYGKRLTEFPLVLREQVMTLIKWKQDAFAYGRPARARHRPVTSKRLEGFMCRLYGFVVNILKRTDVNNLVELVTEDIMAAFTEWLVNERKLNGAALISELRLLSAAVRSYPPFKQVDFKWFPALIAGIPTEPESAIRERKLKKWVPYDVLETVVRTIDEESEKAIKREKKLALEEK